MRGPSVLAALAVMLSASAALAAPPDPLPAAGTDLVIEAFPIFGTGATIAYGWNEVTVRIQNGGARPARGQVEVSMTQFGHDGRSFRGTAPFHVGAGASVNVRVPAEVGPYGDLVVDVMNEAGQQIHETRFPSFNPQGVTLLDVTDGSRLRGAVNEAVIVPFWSAASRSSPPKLGVVSPRFDPATGDPILPDRAALYTDADAVLVRSDLLVRLGGADLDALAGYVLAGGTLAIAVTRPEDVRHATLVAFAGGPVTRQGVPQPTLAELALPAPASTDPTAKIIPAARAPAPDVIDTLVGFSGGNLHGSLYGSSAAYGLGEVHLLAFDPTRKPAADDPWAEARMVDLARRAYDRRVTQVFRPGAEGSSSTYGRVRRELDPNEGSRWAIGAAALLLCVYAILAGPLNFALAARARQPLAAVRRLPIVAALAFVLVVGIGVVAKGVTGRARHLTLIEAGAGMTRGTARRFRGFYASHARDLTVRTTDGSSVVSTAVLAEYTERRDHLVVDREGARLVEVAALPWQTVVVREDGFASLGDGIALVKDGSGMAVVNRAGRALRGALVRAPDGRAHYFPRIEDGARVVLSQRSALSARADGRMWEGQMTRPVHAGGLVLHPIAAHALGPILDADAPGLADAWGALEDASPNNADWFPDGVPTLLAQIDGGEGRVSDAGLRLEQDRLLVRVVGFGGRP